MKRKKVLDVRKITHGKGGVPELPAIRVPCVLIVFSVPTIVEPGEPSTKQLEPCDCPSCQYRRTHTGHA